jgi:polyhydroxyalkanoate synthesis regulator phasin
MAKAKAKTKATSKYHLVNNYKEVSRYLTEVAQKYNDKLVAPAVSETKDTIDLMRKDPKKAIGKISDDGREWIADVQKEVYDRINQGMEEGKDWVQELAEDPRQVIDGYVKDGKALASDFFDNTVEIVEDIAEDGKTLVDDIRVDPRAFANDVINVGKKYMDYLPGVSELGEQVEEKGNAIIQSLNLSTRDDIKKLTNAIDNLNKKIARLSDRLSV